jgi:ABC-type transporter Mla MlaB component
MKWDFQKTGDCGELVLSGEMTVTNLSGLLPVFIESLAGVKHLTLRLEDVLAVDISFLQLICSGHRTANLLQKKMTLDAPESSFLKFVEEAGFSRHFRCPLGMAEGCFWLKEKSVGGRQQGQ